MSESSRGSDKKPSVNNNQGSAISRVLNEIVLAVELSNENLEKFAAVSNMSADEFSRSFRDNAMETVLQFISGLDDIDRHGQSVVVMLNELGFTNLRIADTMRRAALSGNLLRDTVELGTRAFEENTSLMRESEILFSTTAAQQQLLANSTERLKIAVGDALTPALNNVRGVLTSLNLGLADAAESMPIITQAIAGLAVTLKVGIGLLALYTTGTKALSVAKRTLIDMTLAQAAADVTKAQTSLAAAKTDTARIAATKALTAAQAAQAATTKTLTASTVSFKTALMATPFAPKILLFAALAGVVTTVAMAFSSASERAAENARIMEENARAHRETTQTLEAQLQTFEELNSRRLNAAGQIEVRQINEEILELQRQIRESIGAQARELDLANGLYAEQMDLLRGVYSYRTQIDIAAARAAATLQREAMNNMGASSRWGNINQRELWDSGIRDALDADMTTRAFLNSLMPDERADTLSRWRDMLQEAVEDGVQAQNALALVLNELDAINEAQNRYIALTNELTRGIERYLRTSHSSLMNNLIDPSRAEQSLNAFTSETVALIAAAWDDIGHSVRDIASTPMELAVALNLIPDKASIRQSLEEIFPSTETAPQSEIFPMRVGFTVVPLVDEIKNALELVDIQFLQGLNDAGVRRFHELRDSGKELVDVVAALRDEFTEAARATQFEIALESLASKINLLTTAMEEQAETGGLSAETYATIATQIEGYANLLQVAGGHLSILDVETLDYMQTLTATAIHQAIVNGNIEDMIAEFAALYNKIKGLRGEKEDLREILAELQSAYSVLTRAVEEYAESQSIEIGTLKDLLNLGAEYIALLFDENGQIHLNAQSLENLTKARIEELALQQARALVDSVRIHGEESEALRDLTVATQEAAGAMWELVFADIALLNESDEVANVLTERVKQLQALSAAARGNVVNYGVGGRTSGGTAARTIDPFQAELAATKLLDIELGKLNESLTRTNLLLRQAESDGNFEAQNDALRENIRLMTRQQGILHEINNIRRGTIAEGVDALAQHGIRITYTPEINHLEFHQSVDEMQRIINTITIGDAEQTNEIRRSLEDWLTTIQRYNQENERASTQWLQIDESIKSATDNINQVNLASIGQGFSDFLSDTNKELESLNFQIQTLAESDVDTRIDLTTQRLLTQKSTLEQANQQYHRLQQALIDGTITSEQFRAASEDIERQIRASTLAIRQYAEAIDQMEVNRLNQQQAAMNEIVNKTRQMMRQEAQNEIAGLNDQLRDIQAAQNALRDMEQDINDNVRARNDLRQAEIRDMNEALRIQRETARDAIRNLQDELSAFRDLINLRRQDLREQQAQRTFAQNLEDRQMTVQQLQNRYDELARNDSLSARAERQRIQQQLREAQRNLDNTVVAEDIRLQDEALQAELRRVEQGKNAEIDAINAGLRAFEQAHNERLRAFDREREAQANLAQAQIDNLHNQREVYDAMMDNIRLQIADVQDRIARNGDFTRLVFQRIDEAGADLYNQLLSWNRRYSSSIDADISGAWQRFTNTVHIGNEGALNNTENRMMRILELTQRIANAQNTIMSADMGIRSHFENKGVNVDWDSNTAEFMLNGHRFDSAGFTNINDRLFATPAQLLQLERDLEDMARRFSNMNSFDKGGFIDRTQVALIHSGEYIIPADEVKAMKSGNFEMLDPGSFPANAFADFLASGASLPGVSPYTRAWDSPMMSSHNVSTVNNHNNAPISIEINNDGVTSEEFVRKLPGMMQGVAQNVVNEQQRKGNNHANWNGVGGGSRPK